MVVSTIVKTIRSQLMASGARKVLSWGAHNWMQMDELTLQCIPPIIPPNLKQFFLLFSLFV
ncbi:MAG: hypothetical protein A3F12_03405 [Gammaproteobacteria bacterium RIFCSPHIGHO2_12_FULL_38_14]|nr:MAG: hypothetical protein A3F12_03405 [Gammaproteobacteria bacterium RIFCSPHIGHO2_12_FULL_38_14]